MRDQVFFFPLVRCVCYLQKMGLAEMFTGIDRVAFELFLDTQELVVLGQTLGANTSGKEEVECE